MSREKDKTGTASARKAARGAGVPPRDDDIHVPEEAENFEHTLRRLVIEKTKARKGKFGLYQ